MKPVFSITSRLFLGTFLLGCSLSIGVWPNQVVKAMAENGSTAKSAAGHPSISGVSAETVVENLGQSNRRRESKLQQFSYSAPRTYRIKDDKGKVRAEAQVLMQYQAPNKKEFKIVSQTGSSLIHGRVFKPLMDSEAEAASRNRQDSAITPANYTFNLIGEEDVDGHHCFALQVTPKRSDKYLFKGKVWIHATEFAVVKIEGQPAKNPSFFIKQVNFTRRYKKVGDLWLPMRDESVSQVRLFGTNILTVDYNYR
jgi:hypothetical protein